jgi:hypothetical protein
MTFLAPLILGLLTAGERVVEPADLTRDPDLIGREVVVDDRVRYFQPRRGTKSQALEEVVLKRTPVIFRLPLGLRPEHPPRQPAIRLTGVLTKEDGQLYVDVTSYDLLPADGERLDRELKRLDPADGPGRTAWAKWAERRAADFKDAELAARGRAIETDVVLIEADRPKADDLALARRVRDRNLGDDLASALAHRGFRARLSVAKTPAELATLAAEVESFLPKSAEPRPGAATDDWQARMKANPISFYRNASEAVRANLDRALLADIIARRLELRLDAAPGDALALADEAKAKLPDRPEVARALRDRGLTATENSAIAMRLSEVEGLAKTFRDDGQPDRARKVLKDWLDDRRRRLHASDADGHILLADQYDRLLGDRTVAGLLLNDALKADPQARAATDAFRRMGFRKSPNDGTWYDPVVAEQAAATKPAAQPAANDRPAGSLRGMTPAQVRASLGSKPERIVRVATQDDAIEQWIYQGARGRTIVNFRCPRGHGQPEVIANYSLP